MSFTIIHRFWDNQIELSVIAKDNSAGCRIDIYEDDPKTAIISGLYTDTTHRQKGLAKKLLYFCVNLLRDRGCTKIQLRSDEDNWVRQWYIREGFEIISSQVWMEKQI